MCIFTGPIREVNSTKIFGRCAGDRQLLAYAMKMHADAELAMVLPLPVAPGRGEDAVRFIDLSVFPDFFAELGALFPPELRAMAGGYGAEAALRRAPLVVHEVGSFDASYVPTLADFERLDPRFRLSGEVWGALPQFADFGFAVFKLAAGKKDVHPMALSFPTRDPGKVYFPCVHVHDGQVHERADFEHELYCQTRSAQRAPQGEQSWEASIWPPTDEMVAKSQGLLELAPVHRVAIVGSHRNADVFAAC